MLKKDIATKGEPLNFNLKLDIEHIVPKQTLIHNKLTLTSPLCNLCILPSYENKEKNGKTVYEQFNNDKHSSLEIEQITRYLYPEKNELEVIQNNKLNLTQAIYLEFLERRKDILIESFKMAVK